MNVFGFTFLRNGVQYDYPFQESLSSLRPLCKEIYFALGQSEDNTEEIIQSIEGLKLFHTTWDKNLMTKGLILSQQTNFILEKLRHDHPEGWGIYLQADEVLHEEDYELLKSDMKTAYDAGYDAIALRYFHFWETYQNLLIGKRWYPREIRIVRLDSKVESWGDAQSFKNAQKIYQSDATVYHYGHVKDPKKYQAKMNAFHRMYHDEKKVQKVIQKADKEGRNRKTIAYFGPHPKVMDERIEKITLNPPREVVIYSDEKVPEDFLKTSQVEKIDQTNSLVKALKTPKKQLICLKDDPLSKLLFRSKVPRKMDSALATDWPTKIWLRLKLSEKNIRTS